MIYMDKRRKVVTKAQMDGVYTDFHSIKRLKVLLLPLDERPVYDRVVPTTLSQVHISIAEWRNVTRREMFCARK